MCPQSATRESPLVTLQESPLIIGHVALAPLAGWGSQQRVREGHRRGPSQAGQGAAGCQLELLLRPPNDLF
eukprot:596353-Pyramimonas_sp.AAC.1